MEKKEFWEKAEKGLNQAFEAAKKSAKVVAEKAGEAAHVTKLLVDKVSLEHRVSKQFGRLGGCVFGKMVRQGKEISLKDPEVKNLIEEIKNLEAELAQVEATLEKEKKQKIAKR